MAQEASLERPVAPDQGVGEEGDPRRDQRRAEQSEEDADLLLYDDRDHGDARRHAIGHPRIADLVMDMAVCVVERQSRGFGGEEGFIGARITVTEPGLSILRPEQDLEVQQRVVAGRNDERRDDRGEVADTDDRARKSGEIEERQVAAHPDRDIAAFRVAVRTSEIDSRRKGQAARRAGDGVVGHVEEFVDAVGDVGDAPKLTEEARRAGFGRDVGLDGGKGRLDVGAGLEKAGHDPVGARFHRGDDPVAGIEADQAERQAERGHPDDADDQPSMPLGNEYPDDFYHSGMGSQRRDYSIESFRGG